MGDRKSIIRNRPTIAKDEQEEMITIGKILSPMEPINVPQHINNKTRFSEDGSVHKDSYKNGKWVLPENKNPKHYGHTPKSPTEKKWHSKDEDSYND